MMSFAIFSSVGWMLILKFIHVACGILWMGTSLQPSQYLALANQKNKTRFILWVATATLITGLLHIAGNYSLSFYSSWGISMLLGSALGGVMWMNLFIFILPDPKSENLKSSQNFYYTNLILAIPMLFFMEAASHLGIEVNAQSNRWPVLISLILPILFIELCAAFAKGPQLKSIFNAVFCGVILLAIQYLALELLTK